MDDSTRKTWLELVDHFQNMPDAFTDWCFSPFEDGHMGGVTREAYSAMVWPSTFINMHTIRARLKKSTYPNSTAVFDDFRRVFGNGIRFNHNPAHVESGGRAQSFRNIIFACAEEFFKRLPLIGGGVLTSALAREGTSATPFWSAFPGAGQMLRALDQFYGARYAETYTLYFRDGVYYPEERVTERGDTVVVYEDPEDYLTYVPAPIFLADIFERLLVGVFNAPTASNPARIMSSWYPGADAVVADVRRTIDNALSYYDNEEVIKERVQTTGEAWEDFWAQVKPVVDAAAASEARAAALQKDIALILSSSQQKPARSSASGGGAGSGSGGGARKRQQTDRRLATGEALAFGPDAREFSESAAGAGAGATSAVVAPMQAPPPQPAAAAPPKLKLSFAGRAGGRAGGVASGAATGTASSRGDVSSRPGDLDLSELETSGVAERAGASVLPSVGASSRVSDGACDAGTGLALGAGSALGRSASSFDLSATRGATKLAGSASAMSLSGLGRTGANAAPAHRARCAKVLASLRRFKRNVPALKQVLLSAPFEQRVTEPDYAEKIARPICLADIDAGLLRGDYDDPDGPFVADLLLIGANCALYNADDPTNFWAALAAEWADRVREAVQKHITEVIAAATAAAARDAAIRESAARAAAAIAADELARAAALEAAEAALAQADAEAVRREARERREAAAAAEAFEAKRAEEAAAALAARKRQLAQEKAERSAAAAAARAAAAAAALAQPVAMPAPAPPPDLAPLLASMPPPPIPDAPAAHHSLSAAPGLTHTAALARFRAVLSAVKRCLMKADVLHPTTWRLFSVFYEPVDVIKYRDYAEKIARPQCVRWIEAKLKAGSYAADGTALREDLMLIAKNCEDYNGVASLFGRYAFNWRAEVAKRWDEIAAAPLQATAGVKRPRSGNAGVGAGAGAGAGIGSITGLNTAFTAAVQLETTDPEILAFDAAPLLAPLPSDEPPSDLPKSINDLPVHKFAELFLNALRRATPVSHVSRSVLYSNAWTSSNPQMYSILMHLVKTNSAPPRFSVEHVVSALNDVHEGRGWPARVIIKNSDDGGAGDAIDESVDLPRVSTVGDVLRLIETVIDGAATLHSRSAWEAVSARWPASIAAEFARVSHVRELVRVIIVEFFGDYTVTEWHARTLQRARFSRLARTPLTSRSRAILLRMLSRVDADGGSGVAGRLARIGKNAKFFREPLPRTLTQIFRTDVPLDLFSVEASVASARQGALRDRDPCFRLARETLSSSPTVPVLEAIVSFSNLIGEPEVADVDVGELEGAGPAGAGPRMRSPDAPINDAFIYTTPGDFCADVVAAFRRPAEYLVARKAAVARGGVLPDGLVLSIGGGAQGEFCRLAEFGHVMRAEWAFLWADATIELWDDFVVARIENAGREDEARQAVLDREAAVRAAEAQQEALAKVRYAGSATTPALGAPMTPAASVAAFSASVLTEILRVQKVEAMPDASLGGAAPATLAAEIAAARVAAEDDSAPIAAAFAAAVRAATARANALAHAPAPQLFSTSRDSALSGLLRSSVPTVRSTPLAARTKFTLTSSTSHSADIEMTDATDALPAPASDTPGATARLYLL